MMESIIISINKCYDCCHFKKENMELYKWNLPNEIMNNIINYSMDGEEDICKNCKKNGEIINV